jgi:hypothetical protein
LLEIDDYEKYLELIGDRKWTLLWMIILWLRLGMLFLDFWFLYLQCVSQNLGPGNIKNKRLIL